jgi:hypothetical protein
MVGSGQQLVPAAFLITGSGVECTRPRDCGGL